MNTFIEYYELDTRHGRELDAWNPAALEGLGYRIHRI